MSFEDVSAAGSGTQEDPFYGEVSENAFSTGRTYYFYVGAEVDGFVFLANPTKSGDNVGIAVFKNGDTTILQGTAEQPGTTTISGTRFGHPTSITLIVLEYPTLLEFLSNPIEDGVVAYV